MAVAQPAHLSEVHCHAHVHVCAQALHTLADAAAAKARFRADRNSDATDRGTQMTPFIDHCANRSLQW
jgi:hypothetical protein